MYLFIAETLCYTFAKVFGFDVVEWVLFVNGIDAVYYSIAYVFLVFIMSTIMGMCMCVVGG